MRVHQADLATATKRRTVGKSFVLIFGIAGLLVALTIVGAETSGFFKSDIYRERFLIQLGLYLLLVFLVILARRSSPPSLKELLPEEPRIYKCGPELISNLSRSIAEIAENGERGFVLSFTDQDGKQILLLIRKIRGEFYLFGDFLPSKGQVVLPTSLNVRDFAEYAADLVEVSV